MNNQIEAVTNMAKDITKLHPLELIITIDNAGWSCDVSSSLSAIPDGGQYFYSFGNGAEVIVRGYREYDNDNINLIHSFVTESFRRVATTYSQFRDVSCQYTLEFGFDEITLSLSDDSSGLASKGTYTPDQGYCETESSGTYHSIFFDHIDGDLAQDVLDAITNACFGSDSDSDELHFSGHLV